MQLRKPKLEDKEKLKDYVEEHHVNGEMSISASNGMPTMNYEEWLEKLKTDESGENKEWGISETYILEDNDKVIGMLNIRYTLSDEMAGIYGHIGYGVRPTERKKGYATEMLKFALDVCKRKGIGKVIMGCYKDNIGSSKTIEKNGGIKIKEKDFNGKLANYYEIDLGI